MINKNDLGKKAPPAPIVMPTKIVKSNNKASNVKRVTEEHLRVWLAPYQDDKGNFHEGSIVHTVLRSGFWQVQGEI